MGTHGVHTKEVLPWLVVGIAVPVCRYKRFLSCLVCSIQPSTKYYIFPHCTVHIISLLFVPIAQQAGQTVVPGRLSLNMSLLMTHTKFEFLLTKKINFDSGINLTFSAEFTPLGEDHAAEYFFASDARFAN
jgi:hypothetical protein